MHLNKLEARCRERGFPLTWQRRAVYEALLDRRDHPTADALYEALRPRLPGLSRMTVYRALETLVGLGLAARAAHPGAAARFDAGTVPHHHLLCESCGRLVDLEPETVVAPAPPASLPEDFEIREASVYFRGLCAGCRRSPSGELPPGTTRNRTRRRMNP